MKNKINFPEELRYNNIASAMGDKSNFISPRGSIFPHTNIEQVNDKLPANSELCSDADMQEYIASLPNSFEDWLK